MIEIHRQGPPADVANVRRGDVIMYEGEVCHVLSWHRSGNVCSMNLESVFDQYLNVHMLAGTIVDLMEEDSLDNPATNMEIYLALREKGVL